MILQDKINTNFQRNPKLRVLFFFDTEKENLEEVRALNLPSIRVVEFENNWFNLKRKFATEWRLERILLYLPMKSPQTQEEMLIFPLLGLLKANKELRTDSETDFMEEYGLKPHQTSLVKRYIEELKSSTTQHVLKPLLNAKRFEESDIKEGLLCVFLSLSKIEDWDTILVRLLCFGLKGKEKELSLFFKKLNKYKMNDFLNFQIDNYFGISLTNFNREEIVDLPKRLKYNAITQGLVANPNDPYKKFKVNNQDSIERLNRLRERGYAHPTMSAAFSEAIQVNGASVLESKIGEVYGFETPFVYMNEALKWEIVSHITHLFPVLTDEMESVLNRMSMDGQENGMLKTAILFLRNCLELNKIATVSQSFIFDKPENYLEKYINEYARVDYLYRKAILHYRALQLEQPQTLEDRLEQIKRTIDDLYSKFTYKVNREWLECLKDKEFDYHQIHCAKQYDFFTHKIEPLKQKVAVIISDGLRYEVATELLKELHKDDKNSSTIDFQLASLPSETDFGMANLLPGKKFTYDGDIRIDGEKVADLIGRDKVLNNKSSNYKAVLFKTVLDGSKQENRELFKADVVYIYHDIIDKEGHKGTERKVFQAAQNAISELTGMVKRIQGGFGVKRVIITADHGFLYNDCDIEEADKNTIAECSPVDSGARHAITTEDPKVESGYKIALFKTTKYTEPFRILIPDSVNRFKKQGSRYRYTHGGGSLQELIVPIIESSRRDEKGQRKVKPILFGSNLSIASNNLKVTIIQENPLSATEKECVIELGIYNDTQLVSNKTILKLNSVGDSPKSRIFTTVLTLNTKTSETVLTLKIFDVEDLLNPLIEESIKNNTLIERDF
jgi:uncharacterized protein (TIGR02687 family)